MFLVFSKNIEKSQQFLFVYVISAQANLKKLTMCLTRGPKSKYFFFSFCSTFEPRGRPRTSSARKLCHIEQTFSTPPTHFERSTLIEIWIGRGERTHRKKMTDLSNTFEPLGIYRNCEQLRKRIMFKGCFRVRW